MKKFVLFSICALAIASCSKDKDLYDGDEVTKSQIQENVRNILGDDFDTSQGYDMLQTGEVTITANIADFTVSGVQVLTDNPFVNKDAKVLAKAAANTNGKVSLTYDVPKGLDTLYAAVVNDKGHYRVKPFAKDVTNVDFGSLANAHRATRAAVTPTIISDGRNSDNVNMMLKENKSTNWNSAATREDQWENSGWSDKFYDIEATVEDIADFTNDERNELYKVITGIMPENTDNSEKVYQSEYSINTANYFYADGTQKPITITPVRCGADLMGWESLYYYYYNPAEIEGKSEAERALFLKSLPKFKLLECGDALVGLDKGNTPEARVAYAKKNYTSWRNTTRRSRTYTLAYFGDGEPTKGATGSYEFPAGYRIGLMFRVDSVPEHPTLVSQTNSPVKSAVNFYADSLLNNEANLYAKWYYGWNSALRKTMVNYLGENRSRAAIFSANGKAYIGFEDLVDKDFNDVVFEVNGGVTLYEDSIKLDDLVYTYAFEDTEMGDFDLNDVVIKAQRQDATHVKFSLEATGAHDELYIKTEEDKLQLPTLTSKEVHALFGLSTIQQFVNTVEKEEHVAPVSEVVTVPSTFSFAKEGRSIYIENKTKGNIVKLAVAGEDPHGIMLPWDWKYPQEKVCVKNAYLEFGKWGANRIDATDWYKYPEDGLVYTKSVFQRHE